MSEMSLADQFFVDAMSPEFRENPYPHYEAYRSQEPLLRVGDTIWFSFAHTDVTTMLRDPRLSSDERRPRARLAARIPGGCREACSSWILLTTRGCAAWSPAHSRRSWSGNSGREPGPSPASS